MNQITEPIFRGAREALVFALLYDGSTLATSTLGRLAQCGAIGSGRGLHGLDGAGTAALLRARFDRLEDHHAAALIARCADIAGAPWSAAVGELARFVEASGAGSAVNSEVLVAVVRKFFGERRPDRQIADEVGLCRETVTRQANRIRPDLRRIEAEAEAAWYESLRAALLI